MNKVIDVSEMHVAILMATYNGEKFLTEQLESFAAQNHKNWSLHISDDGSTDNTINILNEFKSKVEQDVTIYQGPKSGFAQNFLSLVRRDSIIADYFAFSDQDDIWYADKLETGLKTAVSLTQNKPIVIFTRTELIDEYGNNIGYSPLFKKPASFQNALIQSIGGGNTMLFDSKSRDLLKRIPCYYKVISHDWMSYQIISACDGDVIYLSSPSLEYRQHTANLIGSNKGIINIFRRFKAMLSGQLLEWNVANLRVLSLYSDLILNENKETLCLFSKMRESSLLKRVYYSLKIKLYRQTFLGEIGLFLAVLLKKI